MTKAKIYEFDPVIYPRTLWVVKGGTQAEIKENFWDNEQEEINFGDREAGAWTCDVVRKEDYKYGVVVWFPTKITINYMTHEATHAMFYYGEACGLQVCEGSDNEEWAYLMGWICDCIDKVRAGKAKEINNE